MSLKPLTKAAKELRSTAVRAAWRQWSAIFTLAVDESEARAIVDPEALLLASIGLGNHEPRLWRACRAWARVGARLLSVQRTKNLASGLVGDISSGLAEFAWIAKTEGNDGRWKMLATGAEPSRPKRKERKATLTLDSPPALMLRFRLGLGVGIKPDVLTYLVGLAGGRATIQQITAATHYYGRAVRRGVEELVAAGFVQHWSTAPASYGADLSRWHELLDIDPKNPPAWHPWASSYAFVLAVSDWLENDPPSSATVAASEARDLIAQHSSALDAAGIPPMALGKHPGHTFLDPFQQALTSYAEYIGVVV